MTEEEVEKIRAKYKHHIKEYVICDTCPYNYIDPQEACTEEQCLEQHFIAGVVEGIKLNKNHEN